MNFEWHNADEVMASIRGSQISNGRVEPDGLYLELADERILVIIGLPGLGVAIIQPEKSLH